MMNKDILKEKVAYNPLGNNNDRKLIKLGFSVEGITEAFFVKFVLARYLADFNIMVQAPVILGGNVNLYRVASSLLVLSKENDYVTSLHDFYGFQLPASTPHLNINALELAIANHTLLAGVNNVLPYLQQYEFEALLFSDIDILCNSIYHSPQKQQQCIIDLNANINYIPPEQVNNSIDTAPSKRILRIQKRYKKSVFGFLVAQEIGIEAIIDKCPRFSAWVNKLLQLNA